MMLPQSNFAKIRALRKHVTQALKQLDCPQSLIYGWAGLAMDPTMYALIKNQQFIMPPDSGASPPFLQFTTPHGIKKCKRQWENARNYYLSYIIISRACFRMLDELVRDKYKVSNNPNLLGWNLTMSIQLILTQLETLYGKPTVNIIWNNNVLFTSDFNPLYAPETLFHRIEQCQEVAIIGATPYTAAQLVNNMMHLLLKSGIFPTREFEQWDAIQNKSWPVLKTFVHGTYAHILVVANIRTMMGQQGYVPQNMYNILDEPDNSSMDTKVAHTAAAATTGSTLGNTYQASIVPAELMVAVNTIAENQQSLYQHIAPLLQQMAALSFQAQPPTQACQPAFQTPPIHQLAIPAPPAYGSYHQGGYQQGYQQGCGIGQSTKRRRNGHNNNRRGHGRTAFADHMAVQGCGYGGGIGAVPPAARGSTQRPFQSILVK
jgi:hypothetical protein